MHIPGEAGSYGLLFNLDQPISLKIGRLGEFTFPPGDFLYLGSAQGPGGLRARLRHHARLTDRPHWHLDWLRPSVLLEGGWFAPAADNFECQWSQGILRSPGAEVPAPGFGAADCRRGCPAHLIAFPGGVERHGLDKALKPALGQAYPPIVWFSAADLNLNSGRSD